jgi:hypothetical protein
MKLEDAARNDDVTPEALELEDAMTGLTSVEDGLASAAEVDGKPYHGKSSEQLVKEEMSAEEEALGGQLSVTGETIVELKSPFVKLGPGMEVE